MNKIICDVCGTDYPETAAQCPICGCAGAGSQTSAGAEAATEEKAAYVPVKGGRYSRANVRKRLKANQAAYDPVPDSNPEPEYEDDEEQEETEEEDSGSNRGLMIVVVILLLAIVAVSAYIAISIFGLGFDKLPDFIKKPTTAQTLPTKPTEAPTTAPAPVVTGIPCQELAVSEVELHLKNIGSNWTLMVTPVPADTTEEISFASDNEAIATVDQTGLVTAVGAGETSIRITCGDVVAIIPVVCEQESTVPPEDFTLKLLSKDFTLNKAGATFKLYDGAVDPADITWTTDNEAVVTVDKGIVTAVGNGRTRVYGQYGDQKVSCWVSCKLPQEQATEPTEPGTTEPGETTVAYRLLVNGRVSPYGDEHNAEVTITVDEDFRLTVVNEAGARQNITWEASREGICSVSGSTVTGAKAGKVVLTATLDGQTFKCTIIVKA